VAARFDGRRRACRRRGSEPAGLASAAASLALSPPAPRRPSPPPQPNYWPSGSAGAFIWGTGQTQCAKVSYPTLPEFVPNGAGIFTPPATNGAAGDFFLYTKYRPTYQPFFADQVGGFVWLCVGLW
jgi:hypothetical protein